MQLLRVQPLPLLAGSGRLRGLGQAIGKQLQRPGVKAAGRLGSAGLAVHHGAQAIDGFQNAETGADRFAAGYQALRSAAAAGAATGNPVAGVFTGASVAGDIISNALPQGAQDFIGAGVNDIVTGAGALLGRDWNAVPRGMPAQPPQLRQQGAAAPTLPPGAQQQAQTERTATFNDLSRELNTVPQNLPTGLRDGVVYRTVGPGGRVTFSGQNVREGAQIVDGQGQHLRNLGERGTLSVVPGRAPNAAQANAPLVNQRWEALQKAIAAGVFQQRDGETGRNYRARMTEMANVLGLDVSDLGNQRTNATTLRGQDFDAQERQFQREATLRQRQMLAQIMERAEGDPRRAAAIAASAGLSPKEFLDMAENAQQFSARSAESAEKRIEELMVADAEGRIPDAERARVRAMVARLAPGFFNMSEADQLRVLPDITASVNLLRGANERRNHGLLQMIGWDGSSPEITMLPENLRGAQLGEVTLAEGAFTPGGVRREDYRLRLPDGQVMFIPRGRMDQTMQDFLSRQGVDVGALPR